jgi:two-component system LytT family response regulator
MIRCFIIDDELASIKVLKRYIKRLPHLALLGYETNPMLGIATILREKPDLVFLDIHMEEMNGIDVMKIIGGQTKVVFCTAYSEYAVKSYELAAIDYLMKPIEFDRFLKAVQRVGNTLQSEDKAAGGADYIYVKWEGRGKFLKVDFNDIDYVQAKSNYVGIYGGARNILSYQTMKELEERLPEHKFMRIHKSYIVALDKIAEIDNNVLILKSKVQLPISTNYKDIFLARMRGRVVRDDK